MIAQSITEIDETGNLVKHGRRSGPFIILTDGEEIYSFEQQQRIAIKPDGDVVVFKILEFP